MNIIEAVKTALESGKYFTRETSINICKMKPSNDGAALIWVQATYNDQTRNFPRWNPSAEDILANDWVIVD